jgi:hypothetical protein
LRRAGSEEKGGAGLDGRGGKANGTVVAGAILVSSSITVSRSVDDTEAMVEVRE